MRLIFAGTAQFALPSLEALFKSEHEICAVYTQPDRPAGRGQKLQASPVKQLARMLSLPICQPDTLKSASAISELQKWQADLLVDVAYGLLIPEAVLTALPYGCINLHPSLLPRWRGAAPIERAILAGDELTGISIMQLDAGWDTGDVLRQQEVPITPATTSGDLHQQLAHLGAELLLRVIADLAVGKVVATPQDDNLSCYANKLTKTEAAIDWQLTAAVIDRQVRAFNPRPVAYTTISDHIIRIWRTQVLPQETDAEPGTIIAADKNGIDVATGRGILRLLEIQLPGGKVLPVISVLNAKRQMFNVGNKFHA